MDYEKKYNEALKWMRELYPGLHGATKEDAEHYFPELLESEDERIRKALVWHLKADVDFVSNGVTKAECIAYLEKQKEPTPADGWDYADKRMSHPLYLEGFEAGRAVEREMSEPTAEWSEEDEILRVRTINRLETLKFHGISGKEICESIDWLKSLRPSWKPSASQMYALKVALETFRARNSDNISAGNDKVFTQIESLYEQLKKL